MKKYYDLLGIQEGTTQANIKKHFRQLATKLHPDKGGDPKRFQELTHAYNILVGKERLSRYEILEQQREQQEKQKPKLEEQWRRQEAEFQNEVRSKKIARDAAKYEARNKVPETPRVVTPPKIARTIKRKIYEICRSCNGLGHIREICKCCHGTGNVIGENRKPVSICTACNQSGYLRSSGCVTCEGHGRMYVGYRQEIIWE